MKTWRTRRMLRGVTKSGLIIIPLLTIFLAISACSILSPEPTVIGFFDIIEDPSLSQADSSGEEGSSGMGEDGQYKPVGFINHGIHNATVRPWSWLPLGEETQKTPPTTSTVSSASTSPGLWPNPSRFLTLPLGTYTWCIEWDEGDIDEDGKIDYFHYIDGSPVTLDQNDSDDLDMVAEVDISAPPDQAAIIRGKCGEDIVASQCVGNEIETKVHIGYPLESSNPPETYAIANAAEYPPPAGIDINYGAGTTPWGNSRILWVEGDWVEATTSENYSAIGVQAHGDKTIGWARVLFDGVEVWRGNTAVAWVPGRFAVYIEVSCFAPGTHTIRIEALGIDGGGGGMSVPASYFGFRP